MGFEHNKKEMILLIFSSSVTAILTQNKYNIEWQSTSKTVVTHFGKNV